MDLTTTIEPLNGRNYETWAEDIKVLLIDRGCWEFIEGTDTKPPDDQQKLLRDYKIRKGRAFSSIYLNVSKEYKPLLNGIIRKKIENATR